jgi:hypothetical protein
VPSVASRLAVGGLFISEGARKVQTIISRFEMMLEYKAELKAIGEVFIAEIAVPILEKRGFFKIAENAKLLRRAMTNIVNQVERATSRKADPETGEADEPFVHATRVLDEGGIEHFKAPMLQLTADQVGDEAMKLRRTGDTYIERSREVMRDGWIKLPPGEAKKLKKKFKDDPFFQGCFDWMGNFGDN